MRWLKFKYWLKTNLLALAVIAALVALLMVLTGCQTPPETVELQSADLKARLDEAWGTAGQTQELAGKSAAEAKAIDKATPANSPVKPDTSKHAETAETVAKSASATVKAVEAVKKPAAKLSATATELAEAAQDTWLTWALRLTPIVLGIGLALLVAFVNWKGTLASVNILKPVLVPFLFGIAGLGIINLILAAIPPWMWWTAGAIAALCIIFALLYRFVPAIRAMSQAIKDAPNVKSLVAQVKSAGAHIGPMLEGLGTKAPPKDKQGE